MKTIQLTWTGAHDFAARKAEYPRYANYGPLTTDEFKAVKDDGQVYHQFDGVSCLYYRQFNFDTNTYQVVMHISEDEATYFDTYEEMIELFEAWAEVVGETLEEMCN